jgi:hypothetical protein
MNDYIIPQEFNQSDRIGKYTFPQAFIFGGGILVIMLLLASGMKFWITIPLALIVLIITFYVMYVKKQGIPIYEFLFIYVVFQSTPKLLIYRPDNKTNEFYQDEYELIIVGDVEEKGVKKS